MDNDLLLDMPWPEDLDPAIVPFAGRTVTVLRRHGFYDDWSLFNDLSEAGAAGWWNVGPVTVEDIRITGNEAIRRHHDTVDLRHRIDTDLAAVVFEPWASHIWHWDPRFGEFVPKGDSTVREIATFGTALDRRALWDRLDDLRGAVEAQAGLSLPEAVADDAVSGQHGQRLDVLLAVTGLNGLEPITRPEAARRLNVSRARIYQIVNQMNRRLARARPQDGAWLPQIFEAEETHWPNEYREKGIEATRKMFAPQ
ncbi:MAG: hypothetical protein QGD89_03315 [Actinomycetota bacterium]|nr:hypothetical protein [Actinomycetota bacterium]